MRIGKSLGLIPILLCMAVSLFSQYAIKRHASKDSIVQRCLNDSVDYYEKSGISFFHTHKYDTAIRNFNRALCFLDSLSTIRESLEDCTTTCVTKCNICICLTREKKINQAYKQVPWEFRSNGSRMAYLAHTSPQENDYMYTYMLAFLQYTDGDCYRAMKQYNMAIGDYFIASDNLHSVNCRDSMITYKYALKAYLYKPLYRAILRSYAGGYTTANSHSNNRASLYLNRIPRISQDK